MTLEFESHVEFEALERYLLYNGRSREAATEASFRAQMLADGSKKNIDIVYKYIHDIYIYYIYIQPIYMMCIDR